MTTSRGEGVCGESSECKSFTGFDCREKEGGLGRSLFSARGIVGVTAVDNFSSLPTSPAEWLGEEEEDKGGGEGSPH